MIKQLFDYGVAFMKDIVITKEWLFRFFWFNDWCSKGSSQDETLLNRSEAQYDVTDYCHLDKNEKKYGQQIYEFVEVPSFVAVISYNSNEPVYIIKTTENREADEEMNNHYWHLIAPGELYLKGEYLKPERSKNISRK